ncbi:MAG: inorganic pyrophosphatase Ppa [Desulfobacterales bacterium]|nr:inorganic pyrophosphatase Ppa [Desulfobacterales bacterium]
MLKLLLQQNNNFEIQSYKRPPNLKILKETHIAFSGSPQKHPYDPEKIILVAEPYSKNTFYYEFKTDDISYVEELPNLVNVEGEVVTMARFWIKKMSVGVRCIPFLIEDI